jgi:hypothetical protein
MRIPFLPASLLALGTSFILAAGASNAAPYPAGGNVIGLSISKNPVPAGQNFKFVVSGSGHCKVTMQGFPGAANNPNTHSSSTLPITFSTSVAQPGTYQVSVEVSRDSVSPDWCTGNASGTLVITAAAASVPLVGQDLAANAVHPAGEIAGLPKLAVPGAVGQYGNHVQLRAVLTSSAGQALPNLPVSFTVAGNVVGNASTGQDGIAVVDFPVADALVEGPNQMIVRTGGMSANSMLTIRKGAAQLSLSTRRATNAVSLRGTLVNAGPGNAPLAGRTIVLKAGNQVIASAVTNSRGEFDYLYTLSAAHAQITAEFIGDDHYQASVSVHANL